MASKDTARFTSANGTKPFCIAFSFSSFSRFCDQGTGGRKKAKGGSGSRLALLSLLRRALLHRVGHRQSQGVEGRDALILALPGLAALRHFRSEFREGRGEMLRDRKLRGALLRRGEALDDRKPRDEMHRDAALAGAVPKSF